MTPMRHFVCLCSSNRRAKREMLQSKDLLLVYPCRNIKLSGGVGNFFLPSKWHAWICTRFPRSNVTCTVILVELSSCVVARSIGQLRSRLAPEYETLTRQA